MPYLWLLVFFLVPFLIVLKISFAEFSPLGRPPYEPMLRWLEDGALQLQAAVQQLRLPAARAAVRQRLALFASRWRLSPRCFCLLLGYPMAYAIARSSPTTRNVLLMLIILPFWTSFLLRVYAWIGLLKTDGVINKVLHGAATSSTSRWR